MRASTRLSFRNRPVCILAEVVRTAQHLKLGLKGADALKRILVAVLVPSLLRGAERRHETNLPFVQREGVAPASFHLGVPGIGLGEPVTSVGGGLVDDFEDPGHSRPAQMGAQRLAVKRIVK